MSKVREYQQEKPADRDGFDSNGHQYVARCISNMLLDSEEHHLIGLEGELGAGKSTVIEMIRTMTLSKGFNVVTFDADQYHSELRSSFISILSAEIASIAGTNKKKKAALKEAVDIALGRTFEYTKKVKSNVSPYVIFFGISLLLMNSSLKPAIGFLETFDPEKGYFHWDWLYILFCLSPLLFMATGYLTKQSKFQIGNLLNRNGEDTVTETIDLNRNVGSIELRDAFKRFADVIPSETTMLVVIDNIDRVPPESVKEIWSDLDILTSLGNNRIRFLLPYSKEHLLNALSSNDTERLPESHEYISKRLPINFTVPPIVSVGWRKKFREYWELTLPDLSGVEATEELIDVWTSRVTPRFLKSLVNKIGAKIDSCPEGNDQLNGACCAAYILIREKESLFKASNIEGRGSDEKQAWRDLISRPNEDINSSIYIKLAFKTQEILIKHVGSIDDWSRQISALHYQTTFDISRSELLVEPIRSAFQSKSSDRLIELSTLMGFELEFDKLCNNYGVPHFASVLSKAIDFTNGLDWSKEWVGRLNHWTKQTNKALTSFDAEYISSLSTLLENELEVDLSLCEKSAIELSDNIQADFASYRQSALQNSNVEFDDHKFKSNIKDLYSYCRLTEQVFSLFFEPEEDFFVKALWPNRSFLAEWDLTSKIVKFNKIELYEEIIKSNLSSSSISELYSVILSSLKVGELDSEFYDANHQYTATEIEKIDDQHLPSYLPFTTYWSEGSPNEKLNTRLFQTLYDCINSIEKYEGTLHYAQSLSATLATIVHFSLSLDDNLILEKNEEPKEVILGDLINEGVMGSSSNFTKVLPGFLACTELGKVTNYVTKNLKSDIDINYWLCEGVVTLINDARVWRLNAELFISSGYDQLIQYTEESDDKKIIILDWLIGWKKYFPAISKWSHQLIDDALSLKMEAYISYLIEPLDSIKSKDEWLKLLTGKRYEFTEIVKYCERNDRNLRGDVDGLIELFKDLKSFKNIPHFLINSLCKLIPTGSRMSLMASIRSTFIKNSTTHLERKNFVLCFDEWLSLPKAKDEFVRDEYIAFVSSDHIKDEKVLNWLSRQEIDKKGWNLNEWDIERLEALKHELSNFDNSCLDILKSKVESLIPSIERNDNVLDIENV